jgi:hypothetical protein
LAALVTRQPKGRRKITPFLGNCHAMTFRIRRVFRKSGCAREIGARGHFKAPANYDKETNTPAGKSGDLPRRQAQPISTI